jgi:transketolase
MRKGGDVVLYATGIMTAMALETAALLARKGVEATVLNVPTLKPLSAAEIAGPARGKRLCVTMEEHWIVGGLGSAVAESLGEAGIMPPLLRIGVDDRFGLSGSADELLEHYELTPKQMASRILARLG